MGFDSRRRFLKGIAAIALAVAVSFAPLPKLAVKPVKAWSHGRDLAPYAQTLSSFAPSGLWQLNEATGATSFSDASGNGFALSPTGTLVAGCMAVVPGAAWGRSVMLSTTGSGTGALQCASTSTFDYSALTAMTGVLTFSMPKSVPTATLFSKFDAAITRGYYLLMFPNVVEFCVATNSSNLRKWQCAVPTQSIQNVFVSWNGNPATLPVIKLNGVAQTVTLTTNTGTPANLSNSIPFTIGGRSDGLFWPGLVQCAAFYSGNALTGANGDTIWTAHQVPDTRYAFNYIEDTDQGSTDRGDYQCSCVTLRRNAIGTCFAKGSITTCGDIYSAVAGRAIYNYYGLLASGFLLGAYQGTDCHVGGTLTPTETPSRYIRDQFFPTDDRSNPLYLDPFTFYSTICNAVPDNTLVVYGGGFLSSIAKAMTDGGPTFIALWNRKLKFGFFSAGQFFNSSTAATPPGTYPSTGGGDWNIGGSDAGLGNGRGPAEAVAANLVLANTTKPIYFSGDEICGNVPSIADNINCTMPGWGATNPIAYGGSSGTGSVWTRTAWDYLGPDAAMQIAALGVDNLPWFTVNQIATTTVSTADATAGQNTSTAGNGNVYYLKAKLVQGQTQPQWNAMVQRYLEAQLPYAASA